VSQKPGARRLSCIDESFYRATAAVVAAVLERCGHAVTVIDGSHTEAYEALGRGDADLCVAFWLPEGHAAAWAKLSGRAVELATLYEGARFFWAVPASLPGAIQQIGDLADPAHAALFPKIIRGLSMDATITTASIAAVREYGLDKAGFRVEPGDFPAWKTSLDEAERDRRGVILPLWQPYHLNALYHLRRLDDPRGVLGGINRVALAAAVGLPQRLPPQTIAALRHIGLTLEAVSEMDAAICVGGKTPEQAAANWLKSQDVNAT
jgi:glycine betaine/proline transport system substrate-binding protein